MFCQATWNITNALHRTGGAHFTWDDRKNEGGINWGVGATTPNYPIDLGTDPSTVGFGAGHNDGHFTGNKATWLGRVNYDLSKDFLVYGSVSTGYKSGGLQDGGLHYGPETLTNYELG